MDFGGELKLGLGDAPPAAMCSMRGNWSQSKSILGLPGVIKELIHLPEQGEEQEFCRGSSSTHFIAGGMEDTWLGTGKASLQTQDKLLKVFLV